MNWEDLKIRGLNELDLCSISMFLNVVSPSGLPIMVAFMLSEFVHGSLGFQSPYAIKDSYAEAVTPLFYNLSLEVMQHHFVIFYFL